MRYLILSILLMSSSLHAEAMDPENYLLKITQRLTGGQWPTLAEYADLEAQIRKRNCSEISCLQDYFRDFIAKKMDTPAFYSEASLKVHERFGLQTPQYLPFPLQGENSNLQDNLGIESFLIYRTLKNNLPLDELFTSQIQWKSSVSGESYTRFLDFFTMEIETDKAPEARPVSDSGASLNGQTPTEIDYTGHPNVSGLFSLQKFLTRYWNTPINGNRKRAAAVFKIMM